MLNQKPDSNTCRTCRYSVKQSYPVQNLRLCGVALKVGMPVTNAMLCQERCHNVMQHVLLQHGSLKFGVFKMTGGRFLCRSSKAELRDSPVLQFKPLQFCLQKKLSSVCLRILYLNKLSGASSSALCMQVHLDTAEKGMAGCFTQLRLLDYQSCYQMTACCE